MFLSGVFIHQSNVDIQTCTERFKVPVHLLWNKLNLHLSFKVGANLCNQILHSFSLRLTVIALKHQSVQNRKLYRNWIRFKLRWDIETISGMPMNHHFHAIWSYKRSDKNSMLCIAYVYYLVNALQARKKLSLSCLNCLHAVLLQKNKQTILTN